MACAPPAPPLWPPLTTGATVAGADTTAGKNRQLPGAVTVPGLVTTKPITKHSWATLEKFSTQCKEVGEGGCAFADAYIHSAECKLNLEALEAADQCIRKVLFRAVWVEVFPEAEVDVKEYDDVLTLAVKDDIVKMNDYLLIKCRLLSLPLKCRQDVCKNMQTEREGPAGKFAETGDGDCLQIGTQPPPKCYHYILKYEPGQAKDGFCH